MFEKVSELLHRPGKYAHLAKLFPEQPECVAADEVNGDQMRPKPGTHVFEK